uniref:Putative secreted protein n=1 Tax=Anopheles triannulatus TaxID=58253 RepID=A0A2M4B710_9DIPT
MGWAEVMTALHSFSLLAFPSLRSISRGCVSQLSRTRSLSVTGRRPVGDGLQVIVIPLLRRPCDRVDQAWKPA